MKKINAIGSVVAIVIGMTPFFAFASTQAYQYSSQFGVQGSAPGQLNSTGGVAVDSTGNIYVADTANNRVQKFSSSGTFLSQINVGAPLMVAGCNISEGCIVRVNPSISTPYDVKVDSSDNVYIADYGLNRIQKFSSTGVFISQFGSDSARSSSADGEFSGPVALALDASGNIYVADSGNSRVEKFNSNGVYISQFPLFDTGSGGFRRPSGIAVDSTGNIYVTDDINHRVQKFDANGNYLTGFGTQGTENSQFDEPHGIVVDNSDNSVYVTDGRNGRVQKFTTAGVYVSQFGTYGAGNGQMINPRGITFDANKNILVADYSNSRIQKFSLVNTPSGIIIVTPTSITVNPNEDDTYKVVLASKPTANVVVTITSANTSIVKATPVTLTFKPSNYSKPQKVTVKGLKNKNVFGDTTVVVTQTAISSDFNYNGISGDSVNVTVKYPLKSNKEKNDKDGKNDKDKKKDRD